MIRVKIAGEEVLSNKDFTITEELLKTSSTILDNVYPKTWEETHDYVNNFYFPKDYSSCTIENVEPITPIIGTRVSGNNINLNYNNELSYDIEQLKGNTEQSGTPTPSSPIPVNNVTGLQEIDVVGKNLANIENIKIGKSWNNGNYGQRATILYIPVKTNAQYTLVSSWTNENITNIRAVFNHGASDVTNYNMPSGYPYNNAQWEYVSIEVIANTTFTSTMLDGVKIMLCEGEASIDDYEPYIGKQYEINLGKNLFDKNTITWVRNNDANYTNTSNTNTTRIRTQQLLKLTGGENYTISGIPSGINVNAIKFYASPNSTSQSSYVQTATFTVPTNAIYVIFQFSGTGFTDETNTLMEEANVQVEKGNQVTSYSPYKTPIELCKIGNYQDYLYKNNNKWYLHKEIGKEAFDGTENWNTSGAAVPTGVKAYRNNKNSGYITDTQGYSNMFTIINNSAEWTAPSGNGTARYTSNQLYIKILSSIAPNVSTLKTWLSSNNIIMYGILTTPTDTEITDEELINQLNEVELLNGINNISTLSPNANGELQIYYNYRDAGEDIELIFAGLVKNSGSISLRPTDPKYCSLQILDYKTLLSEGQTLDYVINNKTIKEAIQMVINSVTSYGFIEGNIEIDAANDVIGAYSTLNKTPYDVFQYLADISQSKWFTRVIDDKTIAIDFYDPDKLPKANDIEYTEQYFKDNKIIDINYSFSGSDYRNKQTILSEKVYGNIAINDIITCNGYEQTFTTSQIIGTVNSIKVNNVEKTFATNTEKGLGIVADFYYSPNGNSFESNDLYDAGDKIIMSYYPIVKGRRVISNDDEISRINQQINRNGVISRYEERNDIVDGDELSKVAEAYIKYKGTAEIKLNVLTENKDLFNIGQQVYFDMPNVEDLATDYMVKKKQIEIIQTGEYKNVFYTYELTSNFNSETDINFFDNQRRKAEGNISEDQFITRNVDINNSTNIIFDNLQVIEVQTTDNNTLNCALNSPFIN